MKLYYTIYKSFKAKHKEIIRSLPPHIKEIYVEHKSKRLVSSIGDFLENGFVYKKMSASQCSKLVCYRVKMLPVWIEEKRTYK
jgi:hypothetical protein